MKDELTKFHDQKVKEIGNHIRVLRIKNGLTQEDLAEISFVSQQSISLIELGIQAPTYPTIALFARAFNMSIQDFFFGIVEE